MNEEDFIGYIGDYRFHDCMVKEIELDKDRINITLVGCDRDVISVEFIGIKAIKVNKAEGMVLYAISEMNEQSPYRKFVFVNTDEEDDSYLEIYAKEYFIK